MLKTVSIYCILVFIVFTSCERLLDKSDRRPLHLVNNSNRNVIFYQAYGLSGLNDPNLGSYLYRSQLEPVKRNSVEDYKLVGEWEGYLEGFPDGKMIVFVLDYDSVIKYARPNPTYPNDSNQILKKQFVNIDTLVNKNWTLVYP